MTQGCLITANGLFVERRRGQIPIDLAEIVETETFKTFSLRLGQDSKLFHTRSSSEHSTYLAISEVKPSSFNRGSESWTKVSPKGDASRNLIL